MLTYFINRGGRGLSRERRAVLLRAKELLSRKIHSDKPAQRSSMKRSRKKPAARGSSKAS